MSNEFTTLGSWASENLVIHIPEKIRHQAKAASEALGRDGRGHVAALEALAGHIETVHVHDPRMCSITEINGVYGDREKFEPGPTQKRLLDRLGGAFETTPPPDSMLNELIFAGIVDLIEHYGRAQGELRRERDEALQEAGKAREHAQANDEATAALEIAQRRLGELEAENDTLTQQVLYLRGHLGERADEPTEKQPKKARRTKVDGHRGVYSYETADGPVYEIGYEDNGKRRWKKVGPDLDEAIALRAEMVEKASEREAVAA